MVYLHLLNKRDQVFKVVWKTLSSQFTCETPSVLHNGSGKPCLGKIPNERFRPLQEKSNDRRDFARDNINRGIYPPIKPKPVRANPNYSPRYSDVDFSGFRLWLIAEIKLICKNYRVTLHWKRSVQTGCQFKSWQVMRWSSSVPVPSR